MKASAILLLAMMAVAYAACPNQCSGHGRCGANDKCECYKQSGTPWGQRAGWTGADCSQRTCALDTAFDSISNIDDSIGGSIHQVTYIPWNVNSLASAAVVTAATNSPINVVLAGDFLAPYYAVQTGISTGNSLRTLSSDNTVVIKIVDTTHFKWKWQSDARPGGDEWSSSIAFVTRASTATPTEATDIMLRDPPQVDSNLALNLGESYPTGIRVWFDTTKTSTYLRTNDVFTFQVTRNGGTHYVESNDNSFHQQVECSGRGLCDRTSGQCKCFTGYDGEACQRTTCKNSCSGHGVCQDQSHFFTDANIAGVTYSQLAGEDAFLGPYDAAKQMGCKCDKGFRGPDCSLQECPSGADPLLAQQDASTTLFSADPNFPLQEDSVARDCSGRGVCDYSAGICKCFKGYFGERCETQTNFV